MKTYIKGLIFFALISFLSTGAYESYLYLAPPDLIISPVTPIPATVIQNSSISNIVYKVHNANGTTTYPITFSNLNTLGITFTSTCANLAPGGDCNINMTFNSTGIALGSYIHPFFVLGAPKDYKYILNSKIIASSGNVNAYSDVLISDASTSTSTFDETFTPASGSPIVFNNVIFGKSELSPAIPQGTYTVSITPASLTVDDMTYAAPAPFPFHLAKTGDTAGFVYQPDTTVPTLTDITAPNLTTGQHLTVQCNGPGSYTQAQLPGTTSYVNMIEGSYNCSSQSYIGTDENTYTASIAPVTISGPTTITINYTEAPPSTIATTTNLTMPNAPPGTTVACTLEDGGHTYTHNQPSGSSHFDAVAEASDYSFSCANYNIGSDVYAMTTQTNVVVDPTHTVLTGVFSKKAPPGANYDWHPPHLSDPIADNMFAVWLGGGSTTSVIKISSNPFPDLPLVADVNAYEESPVSILPSAYVKEFPHTLSIGSIGEDTSTVTDQLKLIKLQTAFHYEGDGSGDRGAFWDGPGGYTPQVDALAAQEAAVKTATGNQMINGTAFYTIDYSDGATAIAADTTNDENLIAHEYNLMYEAWRMEYQYGQGNPMVLLMNPDATEPFQNCGINYCASGWKSGIAQSGLTILAAPNLQADIDAAIDRMVSKGYLNSSQGTAMKADLVSSGILTPPSGTGRTAPGLPEVVLSNSWAIKYLAPHIAFGYGNNEYDSANALLQPTGQPAWETASFDWLHKIQHIKLTPEQITNGLEFEAQKYANYLKDMNLVGNLAGNYKPDFLYFDRYERDVSPGYVPSGFLMNGPDWDFYTVYVHDIDQLVGDLPWAYWQMGGATLHVASSHPVLDKEKKQKVEKYSFMENYWKSPKYIVFDHNKPVVLKVRDTAPITVTLNAPELSSTVGITMQDWDPTKSPPSVPHTYTHNVSPGTSAFDNMFYPKGVWEYSYWLVGNHYTVDSKTYWPVCINPYGISNNVTSFTINYAYPVSTTTTSWAPDVESNTPSVTITGNCYNYTSNLTPGTTQPFSSAVVPDSYSASGATYLGHDGQTGYFFIAQSNYVINQTGPNNMFMAWGRLGDTFGNWFFGSPTLNNDMSNLDPNQSMNYVPFTQFMNTNVYYTANSNVKDEIDYLKLTSDSP